MGMDGSLNNLTACEHLQLSTNAIDKFGVALSLPNLKILSVGRNVIKKFDKLDDLGDNLRDILLVGNPMYEGLEPTDAKIEVLRRLPNLAKIDGAMVLQSERDAAAAPPEE